MANCGFSNPTPWHTPRETDEATLEQLLEKAVAGVDRAVVSGEVIAAPEIALAEALNAAWKHFSLAKDISRSELDEAAVQLSFVWSKITHLDTRQLASAAIGIAVENRHSVYDTLYLAACKSNNAPLLTFDEKLR
jgi:predicted nucleic acid-binding protein